MEDIQLFLEQDLGKIIIAIVILILILIVVVISTTISSKRKKAKLANTRTLHRDEFEKATKKRMEYTQTLLRDDITKELSKNPSSVSELEKTVVPKPKAKTATERTMELNLESVRRKLMQDERNNGGAAVVKKEEPLQTSVSSKNEEPIADEIAKLEQAAREKERLMEEARLKEEARLAEEARLIEEARLKEEALLKEIEEVDVVDDNIFDESGYSFEELANVEEDIFDNVTDEDEILPEIDVWSDDFGAESAFLSLDSVEIDDDVESVLFDEDEIESNATSLFLTISSVSATERSVNNIEFVDVEDQSVYADNFEFGKEYFADLIEDETETPGVIFDFGLAKEEDIIEEDSGTVIFGNYFDNDYTYYSEEVVEPIFRNDLYEPNVDDEIDVTVTKAILVDEEVIISDFEKVNNVIADVAPEVIVAPKIAVEEEVVLKSNDEEESIVVQKPQDNENFVVDIHSQLDELDSYEVDLLEEFDFADHNYNYNFNSINVMEEIVEDMLLDDFVEEEDDEYFKYVYQFALLDNMIKTEDLDVDIENGVLDYTIVEGIDKHLKTLTKKIEEEPEIIDEIVEEEEPIQTVERLLEKSFEVDSELMNLTSQVMKNDHYEDEVDDLAYNATSSRRNFVSPIFGADPSDEPVEYFDIEIEEAIEDAAIDEDLLNLASLIEETAGEPVEEVEEIEESSDVDDFLSMINEKMEEDDAKEEEEEFLDILKGLIK